MSQTDVFSAHLNSTGFAVIGRWRLKGIVTLGTAIGGVMHIFDTIVTPRAITYGRSTTTVTVTDTTHGLATGDRVGLAFTAQSGVSATNGNYTITVTDANTYTITDINTGTITAGAGGFAVSGTNTTGAKARWMTTFDTAGAPSVIPLLLPGEGILAMGGIHATMSNETGVTIFYG